MEKSIKHEEKKLQKDFRQIEKSQRRKSNKPVVPRKLQERKARAMVEKVHSEKKGKHIREKLNAHDLMFLAKHMPGEFDAPYVLGSDLSTLHTTTVKSTFSLNQVQSPDGIRGDPTDVPIGSKTFTVMFYCPQLSLFHSGGSEPFKWGGFAMRSSNDPNHMAMGVQSMIDGTSLSYSMADLYGSEGASIANNAFVWSSELIGHCQAPVGASSGSVHYFQFPIGAAFNDDGVPLWLTVNNLKKCVTKTVPLSETDGRFILSNAIVDHDIGARTGNQTATLSDSSKLVTSFGMEMVVGCIIEQPYVSIATGNLVPFPVDVYISSNLAFMPKVKDSIARSIQKPKRNPASGRPMQTLPTFNPANIPIGGLKGMFPKDGNFLTTAMDTLQKAGQYLPQLKGAMKVGNSLGKTLGNASEAGVMKDLTSFLNPETFFEGIEGMVEFGGLFLADNKNLVNCQAILCKLRTLKDAVKSIQSVRLVNIDELDTLICYYSSGETFKPLYTPHDEADVQIITPKETAKARR